MVPGGRGEEVEEEGLVEAFKEVVETSHHSLHHPACGGRLWWNIGWEFVVVNEKCLSWL